MNYQQIYFRCAILAGVLCTATLPAQTILTLAGNGTATFMGDGLPAAQAALNHPRGAAADLRGNIYIADVDNHRVRKISVDGTITTLAGTGTPGFSGDGGPAAAASLNQPQAVAVDGYGNIYIADSQNRRIRRINTSGLITTIAGVGIEGNTGDGGPATSAMIRNAVDLAVDSAGNVYFADGSANVVRKIAANGIITTVAGTSVAGFSGDGGAATSAQLSTPVSVALDVNNNLYIADGDNFRIRQVTPAGTISTVAGSGTGGFAGDGGSALSARLNYPYGVRVDYSGRMFIADSGNNRVRLVNGGVISTFAGNGTDGFSGDGGAATSAMLSFPWAIAIDANGSVMIGDRANSRVRSISMGSAAAPQLFANGTVNGASFAPAGPAGAIAPGTIVSIFGSGMTSATASAIAAPLPPQLADTQVTMNGILAPLFFVSPGQLNAQVPFEINPGQVSIQVRRGLQISSTQSAQVSTVSPGIFTVNRQGTGDAAILHGSSFQTVTASNPAVAGETILIYATGLGSVTPSVASGSPAPTTGVSRTTSSPTVTIGGSAATVDFSGLAPGYVGLYQINAQVPAGLPAGSQPILMRIDGISANTVTMAVR